MENQDKGTWLWLAVVAAILLLRWNGGGLPSLVAPGKPIVVMMNESLHGSLPSYTTGAANELTAAGYDVRMIDDDVTDGTGETPEWLKPALAHGRKIMGGDTDELQKDDALILLRGGQVAKAIKIPGTKSEILEAVK